MLLINDTPEKKLFREVRTRVLAGMETGNHDNARSVLKEYAEVFHKEAASIVADVQEAYGIRL